MVVKNDLRMNRFHCDTEEDVSPNGLHVVPFRNLIVLISYICWKIIKKRKFMMKNIFKWYYIFSWILLQLSQLSLSRDWNKNISCLLEDSRLILLIFIFCWISFGISVNLYARMHMYMKVCWKVHSSLKKRVTFFYHRKKYWETM